MSTPTSFTVIALVRDLLLASRITTAAKSADVPVTLVRDPGRLAAQAGTILLVDLNLPGAIDAAAEWGREMGGQVIGFVAHADATTIAAARAAGIERIMARSGFVEALPQILSNRS